MPEHPIIDQAFDALSTTDLLRILALREAVFVVEQACAYPEIDGRDEESATRHVWLPHGDDVAAYLRLLEDPDATRIGRVVTAAAHRRQGHSGRLMDYVLHTYSGPWILDAQSHLTDWYATFGFHPAGREYLDYGIPHVPMRLD